MFTGEFLSRFLKIILVLPLLLTGCLRFGVDVLRDAELTGTPFQNELARSYLKFAESEAEQYDWSSAQYFANKGLTAAKGSDVEPELVEDWGIPEAMHLPLQEARDLLIKTVTGDVKQSETQTAARAYFLYDCWMEQQEENWQTEHIDACRNQFFETIDYLSVAVEVVVSKSDDLEEKNDVMVDPSMIEPVEKTERLESPLGPIGSLAEKAGNKSPGEKSSHVIMFDYDSIAINKDGAEVIKIVIEELEKYSDALVVLNGHSDRAGDSKYNLVLSKMRAIAVKSALIEKGVKDSAITVNAFGENKPKVKTPDGKKEKFNRVVEVIIE